MADEQRELVKDVARKARRKERARKRGTDGVWSWLGMFGLVGWSIAVPTLIGVMLGVWLDRRFPGRPSWTLTLLVIGLALGCLNAWQWVRRESERD